MEKTSVTLKYITDRYCPTCGAEPVLVEIGHKHTNGQREEGVRFKCGARFRYSPNFQRVTISLRCPKHPTSVVISSVYAAVEDKLNAAIARTIKNINLPADDEQLLNEIKGTLKQLQHDLQRQVHYHTSRYTYK